MPEGHRELSSDLYVHIYICAGVHLHTKHARIHICTCANEHTHIKKKNFNKITFLLERRKRKEVEIQVTSAVDDRKDHNSSYLKEGS